MIKERCNYAAGPWYLSSDKEPPRDGRLIVGQWRRCGYAVMGWKDKRWQSQAPYWVDVLLAMEDPSRWAEIRLPGGGE